MHVRPRDWLWAMRVNAALGFRRVVTLFIKRDERLFRDLDGSRGRPAKNRPSLVTGEGYGSLWRGINGENGRTACTKQVACQNGIGPKEVNATYCGKLHRVLVS